MIRRWPVAAALLLLPGTWVANAQDSAVPPPPPVPTSTTEPAVQPAPASTSPTPSNKVKGMTLPELVEADPREGYVVIHPTIDEGLKAKDVKWIAIIISSNGDVATPKHDSYDSTTLTVAVPQVGETIVVHAVAEIEADPVWATEQATSVIIAKSSTAGSRASPSPAVGSGSDRINESTNTMKIPSGLSVVLVFDPATASPELMALLQSQTLRDTFQRSGSKIYAYARGAPVLAERRIAPLVQRLGRYPAVVVIADGGRSVLPNNSAILLPVGGDAKAIEQALLSIVNQAAGVGR